jgi:hypothetical protein
VLCSEILNAKDGRGALGRPVYSHVFMKENKQALMHKQKDWGRISVPGTAFAFFRRISVLDAGKNLLSLNGTFSVNSILRVIIDIASHCFIKLTFKITKFVLFIVEMYSDLRHQLSFAEQTEGTHTHYNVNNFILKWHSS